MQVLCLDALGNSNLKPKQLYSAYIFRWQLIIVLSWIEMGLSFALNENRKSPTPNAPNTNRRITNQPMASAIARMWVFLFRVSLSKQSPLVLSSRTVAGYTATSAHQSKSSAI
jgi:hypothetical protein